jgi:serine/threonine protein phosphatase PrpC
MKKFHVRGIFKNRVKPFLKNTNQKTPKKTAKKLKDVLVFVPPQVVPDNSYVVTRDVPAHFTFLQQFPEKGQDRMQAFRLTKSQYVNNPREPSKASKADTVDVFVICDGHGMGNAAVDHIHANIAPVMAKNMNGVTSIKGLKTAITTTFAQLNDLIITGKTGSVVGMIVRFKSNVVFVQCGDLVIAGICEDGIVYEMPTHDVNNDLEFVRVGHNNIFNRRLYGQLSPFRAFGNADLHRPYGGWTQTGVSVEPQFTVFTSKQLSTTTHLILASDGIVSKQGHNQHLKLVDVMQLPNILSPYPVFCKEMLDAIVNEMKDDVSLFCIPTSNLII